MGTFDPAETAYCCHTAATSNCSYSYNWAYEEECVAARKAYWIKMRRNRAPWWLARHPLAMVSRSRPTPVVVRFPASSTRKPAGRRYGGIKRALRMLAKAA